MKFNLFVVSVIVMVFFLSGYLWTVEPLGDDKAGPSPAAGEKEVISKTGFEYSEEEAPPEILQAIELKKELKREVIQRKQQQQKEKEVKEAPRQIVTAAEEALPVMDKYPSRQLEKISVSADRAEAAVPPAENKGRGWLLFVIPLSLIALGLAWHIYGRK